MRSRNGHKKADTTPRIGQGSEKKIGVLIAIPTRGTVRVEFATMLRALSEPMATPWGVRTVLGEQVDTARNALVRIAQQEGADFIFFLDDDTLCPPGTLFKLMYEMSQRPTCDLITAIVPTRSEPPVPTVFKFSEGHKGPYWDWKYGEVFEIDACGMAATLVRLSAFDKVPAPWFVNTRSRANASEGEDTYFCRRLREAGGHLFADGKLCCGHIAESGKLFQLDEHAKPFRDVDFSKLTHASKAIEVGV